VLTLPVEQNKIHFHFTSRNRINTPVLNMKTAEHAGTSF